MRTVILMPLLVVVCSLGLVGCSGSRGTASSPHASRGAAQFTITWSQKSSRLIPEGANSIKIELTGPTPLTRVIPRPPSGTGTVTETVADLAIGDYTAKASAYPNADGSGVAQATGTSALFAITKGGTTPSTVTMSSTITKVEIWNNRALIVSGTCYIALGDYLMLRAVAFDSTGKVVTVAPEQWEWTSDNSTDFTLTPEGSSAKILALGLGGGSLGGVVVRVKDKESGKFFGAGINSHATLTFEPLGRITSTLPKQSVGTDTSDDGSVVVGYGLTTAAATEALYWTRPTDLIIFGTLGTQISSYAYGVSGNGNVVVGKSESATTTQAFRGTLASGFVGMGDLAGGAEKSIAYGTSQDGSVVVGSGTDVSGTQAFRWTTAGGMVGLGELAGGAYGSWATAVSSDGTVIVGASYSAATTGSNAEAFRWTAATGMVALGDLAGGEYHSQATAISGDGSVVVGESKPSNRNQAFRWTATTGIVSLGTLPGGIADSFAFNISKDGTRIVGQAMNSLGKYEAYVWTQALGMRSLNTLLTSAGIDLTTWPLQYAWSLTHATSISADNKTIIGVGAHGGFQEAFRVYKSNGW